MVAVFARFCVRIHIEAGFKGQVFIGNLYRLGVPSHGESWSQCASLLVSLQFR
jgi:hypothetical protein